MEVNKTNVYDAFMMGSGKSGGWRSCLMQSKTQSNHWQNGDVVAEFKTYNQKMDLTYGQSRWIPNNVIISLSPSIR